MNKGRVIIDTGPLVAFLAPAERSHRWAIELFKSLQAPFYTCEAVLTETFYFLSKAPGGSSKFFELLSYGLIAVDFSIKNEFAAVEKLIKKYQDLPMSIADACLVRMAKEYPAAVVLTLYHHFKIYRRSSRQPIDVLTPLN